jgi:uncharacterized membrane protein
MKLLSISIYIINIIFWIVVFWAFDTNVKRKKGDGKE